MYTNTTLQENEFRKVCKLFGDYFSEKDVSSALKTAREISEDYVEKLISGVKAIQIVDPKYFQNKSNERLAQFYGKEQLLLGAAQYKLGKSCLDSMFRTMDVLNMHEDKETSIAALLRQKVGSGNFDPEKDIVFYK